MLQVWSDVTDRRLDMEQTKQTVVWVLVRPNRPKIEYGPDKTDRCLGIGQTEYTQFRYGPDRTDPVSVWARRTICPDYELGRTGPPVRDPGPSGPYLSWVADFILGAYKDLHEKMVLYKLVEIVETCLATGTLSVI